MKQHPNYIYVGDFVEVVKGKKVPIGTVGIVKSIKDNPYTIKYPWVCDMCHSVHLLGYELELSQMTNGKVVLEDSEGNRFYTYYNNIKRREK